MCSSSCASCSMYQVCESLPFSACSAWTSADIVCCCASSWSICCRCAMYSRTGYARLSAMAQITTASSAARPVSLVDRATAAMAAACAGDGCAGEGWACVGMIRRYSSGRGEPRERGRASVGGRVGEVLLDAKQLVVLGDPLAAGRGPGLELPRVGGNGQGGEESVVGLARAVADHASPASAVRHADRVEGLAHGADLVHLDEQGVGRLLGDA